ncbi:ABC transporter ATP-binding protein [Bacillus sp. OAE603]|uniref:ABC transporter ATP-binding protein n=1 Tax=Gottfriedia sp. OAE603 TaxID=2663872 RepID=UPI001788EBE8
MSYLTVNEISHVFLSKQKASKILDSLTFKVDKGEFVSILGPSGCGKSTLLSIISSLLTPYGGSVQFKGHPYDVKTGEIGYMLQHDYLFPWKSIKENIFLGLEILGKDSEENKLRALELLKEVGLEGYENAYPRELSGGMRQRVALVRTLATSPSIVLLDEPFSALDYQNKVKLEELVFHLFKKLNTTALLVTHDIEEAVAMCDRVITLTNVPTKISNIFPLPEELRNNSPFEARQQSLFPSYVSSIWKELEKRE